MKKKSAAQAAPAALTAQSKGYTSFFDEVSTLLKASRHASARAVNAVMTATYWEIGRRIVEFEQAGGQRAEYGAGSLNGWRRILQTDSVGVSVAQSLPDEKFYLALAQILQTGLPIRQFFGHCLRNL